MAEKTIIPTDEGPIFEHDPATGKTVQRVESADDEVVLVKDSATGKIHVVRVTSGYVGDGSAMAHHDTAAGVLKLIDVTIITDPSKNEVRVLDARNGKLIGSAPLDGRRLSDLVWDKITGQLVGYDRRASEWKPVPLTLPAPPDSGDGDASFKSLDDDKPAPWPADPACTGYCDDCDIQVAFANGEKMDEYYDAMPDKCSLKASRGSGKGLLDEDQAEGLRSPEFQAEVCAECYRTDDSDINRVIAHEMVTLREMLNPERVADLRYLRDVRSWIASLNEHIDRLEFGIEQELCQSRIVQRAKGD